MTSSQSTNLHVEQANLDDLLFESQIFSQRITGRLKSQGIVTLRLLLMHTDELLRRDVKWLGTSRITEIENVLAIYGRRLAETADEKNVTLARLLAQIAFHKITRPVSLLELTQMINESRHSTNLHVIWDSDAVAVAAANHRFIKQVENGYYICINVPSKDLLSTSKSEALLKEGKILLSLLWPSWLEPLLEKERVTLFLYYGTQKTIPLSPEDVSKELGVGTQRIYDLKKHGLQRLRRQKLYSSFMHQLLADGIRSSNNLLTLNEWEHWLNENTVWEGDEPTPSLLQLLCDIFNHDFHYLDRYHVATVKHIVDDHLEELNKVLKATLRQHRKTGLTAEELTTEVQRQLSTNIPDDIRDPVFIFKAIDLFDKIEQGGDGRYFYKQQRPKTLYPPINSGWAGKPGTRLYDWELNLRQQFEKVAWIGELRLSQDDFTDICLAIQEEAKAPHLFSKIVEGQPRLVPPAVFVTTMVFTARYAEKRHDEERYEFWHPYIRYVWGIEEYSQAFPKGPQAFQKRCQQRFNESVSFLEAEYNFKFPRTGKAQEDVITPIFRHALIPRYIQSDFAQWLHGNWRNILVVADTPATLAMQLQKDQSLDLHYSYRLKSFIRDAATAETAAALITNMATAISLHINDCESIESICDLLADSPIEQELWLEIVQAFAQ